jgi:hypothetical protein
VREKYVPRRRAAHAQAGYTWIFDLLFAAGSTVTWAPAGELPAGYERADQFAVLPAIAGRSFVVSLASRRGSSSALTSYNALRTAPRRLVRVVFSLGLRTGLARPAIQDRIDIGIASAAPADQRAGQLLTEYLRRELGLGPVVIAFGGGEGPYRKPVLQVFGMDGTPLAYVKVGWNDWTREAVRREAAALRGCAASPMGLGVPALIGHRGWQGLDLLITAPLPGRVRRLGLSADLPDASVLREISQISGSYISELGVSPWWRALRTRIGDGIADSAARAQLELIADGVERRYGRAALEFGSWHGDFVPWNLARLGQRVYAWDWESSGPDTPVGFDALHYHFQVAFVARRRPLAEAAMRASHRAGPALEALGVRSDRRDLLAALHLMELFARHEEARSSAGGVDHRFYPAVAQQLARSLAGPLAAAGLDAAERAA